MITIEKKAAKTINILQVRDRVIAQGFVKRLLSRMRSGVAFINNALPACKTGSRRIVTSPAWYRRIGFRSQKNRDTAITRIIRINWRRLSAAKPDQMRFGKIKAAVSKTFFDEIRLRSADQCIRPAGGTDLRFHRRQNLRCFLPPVKACGQFISVICCESRNRHTGTAKRAA